MSNGHKRFLALLACVALDMGPGECCYIPPPPKAEKMIVQADQPKWNYLMDCLPRYFEGQHSILDIATLHDLPFDQVYQYLLKFRDKGLVKFVEREL